MFKIKVLYPFPNIPYLLKKQQTLSLISYVKKHFALFHFFPITKITVVSIKEIFSALGVSITAIFGDGVFDHSALKSGF